MEQVKEHKIGLIDMVVVNLYPFGSVTEKKNVTLEEAIENIDIGGPSMLRSAAKNYRNVAVISDPDRYQDILNELDTNNGLLAITASAPVSRPHSEDAPTNLAEFPVKITAGTLLYTLLAELK